MKIDFSTFIESKKSPDQKLVRTFYNQSSIFNSRITIKEYNVSKNDVINEK